MLFFLSWDASGLIWRIYENTSKIQVFFNLFGIFCDTFPLWDRSSRDQFELIFKQIKGIN